MITVFRTVDLHCRGVSLGHDSKDVNKELRIDRNVCKFLPVLRVQWNASQR